MDAKTTLISRLVTIAAFLILSSFSGTSLAFTQLAFGWNFTADGDWGCTSATELVAQKIRFRGPERVLALGDLSYQDTPDCWLDITRHLDPRMRIAIGNHDDVTSSLLNAYIDHFNLFEQYYSFDYERAHFLVLSTELVSDTAQLEFARKDLQRTSADYGIDWIFVYMHKPMYTSPTNHAADAEMRDKYHPLFDRYGVDIVLYGHNHNYERSYPLKYDSVGNPATPIVTTTETTNYNDPEGAIFATVGTGGKSLYQFTGKASYIVKQQDDRYGFLDIVIEGNQLTARYFVTTPDALQVVDRFTISK
jgi:hypothetical protein